ncbi:DUF7010 family protein [Croceivirga radicis]|uniref:DUF7010 family protein n=1 Tax=Croceivirga radicis TaxID=1929488 RepID=UPI000255B35F|nr:hypothetical protein [Croceivirga radicis]
MTQEELNKLKIELSVKAKNGLDFILSGTVIWCAITIIWTLDFTSYSKSVFTFMLSGLMLPLAFGFSKLIKSQWKVANNPLQPLGLWLNLAQLFYFPFLILIITSIPDYFLFGYVVITGAHFFPYAWYYKESGFAVLGGIISFGSLFLTLYLAPEHQYWIGVYMVFCLLILALRLYTSYQKRKKY